jgi:hypothetical protein
MKPQLLCLIVAIRESRKRDRQGEGFEDTTHTVSTRLSLAMYAPMVYVRLFPLALWLLHGCHAHSQRKGFSRKCMRIIHKGRRSALVGHLSPARHPTSPNSNKRRELHEHLFVYKHIRLPVQPPTTNHHVIVINRTGRGARLGPPRGLCVPSIVAAAGTKPPLEPLFTGAPPRGGALSSAERLVWAGKPPSAAPSLAKKSTGTSSHLILLRRRRL